MIRRYCYPDKLPEINAGRVCIFVGAHRKFSNALEQEVDEFCSKYNAMVLCDQTSNYKGRFRALGGALAVQNNYYPECRKTDPVIHIGKYLAHIMAS